MNVIDEIAAERKRQIEEEDWSLGHDDEHEYGEMATAAACYALPEQLRDLEQAHGDVATDSPPLIWPWNSAWWKPKNRRRDLIRAGALIVAEIERLDRLPQPSKINRPRIAQVSKRDPTPTQGEQGNG